MKSKLNQMHLIIFKSNPWCALLYHMEIAPAWISVAILKVLRIWLCVLFILICMFGQIIDIIRQQCFLCNIYSINFRKEINAQWKQREISLADRILPTQRASASIDHPDLSTRSTFRNMDFHCELSPSHQKKHRPWEVYDNCATHIDLQYGHKDNSMGGMFFQKSLQSNSPPQTDQSQVPICSYFL